MKRVLYSPAAQKALRKHANLAPRVRKTLLEYAAGEGAHRNQVIAMTGAATKRLRIGDFRVVFEEDEATILVARIGPRGEVYDD